MPEMEPVREQASSSEEIFHCHDVVGGDYVSEIEEVLEDPNKGKNEIALSMNDLALRPLASIKEDHIDGLSLCSYGSEDCVYVGVGKSESSMDALMWALKNAIEPSRSTTVYLVHVFPEIRFVPSPLGNLPISRVNKEQLESFMAQERGKRRELLQKFLSSCQAFKVQVDTILIESDMVAKAMLDLVPVLNIRTLVVGCTKSSLRKLRSRKGNGVVDQILQNVPETCDLKIICDGNQVVLDQLANDPSPLSSPVPSPRKGNGDDDDNDRAIEEGTGSNGAISCMCFRSR